MDQKLNRRCFLQATAAGAVLGAHMAPLAGSIPIVSPGCRKSKVPVAKVYLGVHGGHWPHPKMDLRAEVERYEAEFAKREKEFADVDFIVSELVTTPAELERLAEKIKGADGVLAMHLSMGISATLRALLALGKPTVLFAAPYSGHEWCGFGQLRQQPEGALLECMLTSDFDQLAAAVRPFRAIHHLREAKILDITARDLPADYCKAVKAKFGTEIVRLERAKVLAAYESIPDAAARAEAERWTGKARAIVEPSADEIFRSSKLALAFEKLVDEEGASVLTTDCYGTMWKQLPAFPCLGHIRLSDMGLGGICESDLQSAMTHIIMQGLCGKPGFISDPTVDESDGTIILAHCLCATKMDGPDGEAAPYKLRCIMERQDGAVAQVAMRVNQRVTQAELLGTDLIHYFTGTVTEVPDLERGCRSKIRVKVDGCIETLWQNWSHGLHRQTCYGDIIKDLRRFSRFKGIKLVDEANPASFPKAEQA